ncbi:hypothetical protein FBU59_002314 [Linderina macrospora]|uniref:Uncharacterized protein n=1 Tax=Linderina macrospora TaxID=4868 RepID=A0ACC1JBD7_9FUNG|nr:hypothetical protein FBU59_002314 [Linderina macrospora]
MPTRIGLVPEHFSAPLVYGVENGLFGEDEIELVICKRKNPDLRLFGTYVDSPLPWAVSVAADAKYATVDDLAFGATFGISRPGSGSEVMARYAASAYEWTGKPEFAVLGDVHGLVKGIQEGAADAFLWERTTMQRHYDANEVRYLGTVRPPWPAFSFGATAKFIEDNGDRITGLLGSFGKAQRQFMEDGEVRAEFLKHKFGYGREEAERWAGYVRFNEQGSVDQDKIRKVIATLAKADAMQECSVDEVVLVPK